MRTASQFSLALIFMAIAVGLTGAGPAAAQSKTVLIIDTTAQMRAKLGRVRKIWAVKSATADAVKQMDPKALLGVWAFGTEPAKKCKDTVALTPMQPAGKAARALAKALRPVWPKAGRAPVFAALKAALAAAGEPKDAAINAVIIAGTGDDCLSDICSEAKTLHSIYPNAKLNVLGIKMREKPAEELTCAAKAMGGEFTAVKSASDLSKQLQRIIGASGGAKPKEASAAPPSAPEQPAPAPPPPPKPEPNIVLSAVLAEGQPPLDAGVTWELYKIRTTPTGQQKPADSPGWTGGGGKAEARLAAGSYAVRVTYGFAKAEDSITVNGGKTEKTVLLNAGTIAAEGLQKQGGRAAEGVLFVLRRRKQGGGLEELGRSGGMPTAFHVNAGIYELSALAGPAALTGTVRVEAGKVTTVRMALNVGTLEIKAYETEGAAGKVSAWHRIYPAGGASKKPLLTAQGMAPRVQLPAGDYRLETVYGNARVESAFSIAAGQTVAKTVILSTGQAKISVPAGKPARVCTVYEEGADRGAGPAGRAAGTAMSFVLRAGVYSAECRAHGARAPAKPVEFRVVAGKNLETELQ